MASASIFFLLYYHLPNNGKRRPMFEWELGFNQSSGDNDQRKRRCFIQLGSVWQQWWQFDSCGGAHKLLYFTTAAELLVDRPTQPICTCICRSLIQSKSNFLLIKSDCTKIRRLFGRLSPCSKTWKLPYFRPFQPDIQILSALNALYWPSTAFYWPSTTKYQPVPP